MSRRLRLLLTTDALGGVWTYSLDLAAALASEADVNILLVTLGPPPSIEQQMQAAAIPGVQLAITDLPLDWTAERPEQIRSGAETLAALATEAEVDLVQLHSPALAVAHYPTRVISVVHSCLATWWSAVRGGEMPADFGWRSDLAREGLGRSALVVTPTRAFARAVQQAYRLNTLPTAVHNGRSSPPAMEMPQEDFAFTAGRLWDEGKNVAAFDRAAGLAAIPFKAAGALVGPNGAVVHLPHAQALGSLGTSRLCEQFSAQPIFVSAALYEPFGLTTLEAAQAGCALVLADIPTFRELWEDAALLIDPNPNSIAATVDLLATRPDERARLGAAARERAARYTPQSTARAMLREYRPLLQAERRVAA
jgi:glycosyltransferase involved in cell wall biosynthesis